MPWASQRAFLGENLARVYLVFLEGFIFLNKPLKKQQIDLCLFGVFRGVCFPEETPRKTTNELVFIWCFSRIFFPK